MCASTLLFTLLGTDLVASWAHFGSSWECFGNFLGEIWHVEQFLEPTSEHLSSQLGYKHFVPCFFGSCVYPGASWNDLGRILEPVGAILVAFWNLLGRSWNHLGTSSSHLVRMFFVTI